MSDPAAQTSLVARSSVLAYGIFCYAIFLATFVYAIGFIGGFGVPTTLDGPRGTNVFASILINLALLSAFALQHSVMARPAFKRAWTRLIPAAAERSTYVLFSSAALIALFAFWEPLGGVVWHVTGGFGVALLYGGFAFGWVLILLSTCVINHFDLFGLRQVWLYFRGRPYTDLEFVTPWLYRVIRHPLYLGWLFVFWCTPTMSGAHFMFAVITTAYIFIAVRFEEHDLEEAHRDYVEYKRNVPMIVPGAKSIRRHAPKHTAAHGHTR